MTGIPLRGCRHDTTVPSEIRELFWKIAAVDTYAMTWAIGTPITFCVMSRANYERAILRSPDDFRVVDSIELRDEASRLIKKYGWPLVNDGTSDALLVLAPAF